MAVNGKDIVLQVNTGTVGSPSYTTLAAQTNVEFTITNSNIDASTKDSASSKFEYGRKTETATVDFLFDKTGADIAALRDAIRNRTKLLVRRYDTGDSTVKETATVVIDDFTESFPDQDNAVVTVTISVDGDWA